jgi:spoIIIJ-associated protein
VRPKPDRRRRPRGDRTGGDDARSGDTAASDGPEGREEEQVAIAADDAVPIGTATATKQEERSGRSGRGGVSRRRGRTSNRGSEPRRDDGAGRDGRDGDDNQQEPEVTMSNDVPNEEAPGDGAPASGEPPAAGDAAADDRSNEDGQRSSGDDISPEAVGEAAVAFMDGLIAAFGASGSSQLTVAGTELDVSVEGEGLGLLVGSGGRTLNAIQDLARVAAQRRLGDHETRLRIDVAGYRSKRQAALAKFARDVAETVRTSGSARSMEPMSSADRKVIHDVLNEEPGVSSRSEGEDPDRRIVVVPAD